MSEDAQAAPVYILLVHNLDNFISARAQSRLNRGVFDRFMENIRGARIKNANLRIYFSGHTAVSTSIDTDLGRVEINQIDDTPLAFEFYKAERVPRSIWRAGQLLHSAVSAACAFYNPGCISIMTEKEKCVRDLVAVRVDAVCGNNRKSGIVSAAALHYSNGRAVRQSECAVRDFEQEIIDELKLQGTISGPALIYHTSIAYVWHQNHGILPGFGNGRVPTGLEVKIISSNEAPLHSGASKNSTAPQPASSQSP